MASSDDWQEPLPTLTGRAWAFGVRLAADDILPPRLAGGDAGVTRRRVFADIDRAIAARLRPGDVVVAEEHVGIAGTAGPALTALRAAGVTVLVGRRFDPAVEEAALAARIVPVILDAPSFLHTGDRVRVDLEDAKVVNLSSGDRAPIRNLGEARRTAIRALFAHTPGCAETS